MAEDNREFQLVSVVAAYDPVHLDKLTPIDESAIAAIEQELSATLRIGRAATEMGSGSILGIQRQQIDLIGYVDRFEVRSLQTDFNSEVAQNMAKFLNSVVSRVGDVPWTRFGYNFVVMVDSAEKAIEHIRPHFFRGDLEQSLGYSALGGAAWVWLKVEEATLWLKLEPYRNLPDTTRVVINANFEVPLANGDDAWPDIAEQLTLYWGALRAIMDRIEL